MTKHFLPLLAVFTALGCMVSCESNQPKRKKTVAPTSDVSGLPWSRPTQAEAAGRFGNMMPQSR
jgi:hypothetical protein